MGRERGVRTSSKELPGGIEPRATAVRTIASVYVAPPLGTELYNTPRIPAITPEHSLV